MENLTKPEFIAAGGSLLVSIGSFIYLNSKIDTIDENFKKNNDRFVTMVAKMSEYDEGFKINKSKFTELENFQKGLLLIQRDFTGLKSDLLEEFKQIEKTFKTQDKRIKSLESKLNQISVQVGIDTDLNETIIEDVIPEKRLKKTKTKLTQRTPQNLVKQQKQEIDDDDKSIADEMNLLLGT